MTHGEFRGSVGAEGTVRASGTCLVCSGGSREAWAGPAKSPGVAVGWEGIQRASQRPHPEGACGLAEDLWPWRRGIMGRGERVNIRGPQRSHPKSPGKR